jgi:uncharacterized phage protein gp47/JayE
MPFARPSLTTLIERAVTDIESHLPGADARLCRSNLNVLARVSAASAHGLYGYLDYLARQILPDTAEAEILERHASIWLDTGRLPAAAAYGQVTVSGAEGVVVAAGTVFKRADGARFVAVLEATISDGAATLAVAAAQSGQSGNTPAGLVLRLDSPIAGVNSQAVVTVGAISGGADVESDESLRARLLERIRQPPMGGAAHDYVTWAREVPGVTRAWVSPLQMGDGTVVLRFVRDNDDDMIPDADEVAAVQAWIDARRPVTAHLFVVAPVPVPIHFDLELVPATQPIKAAVEAGLRDLLLREAAPEDGAGEGRILVSHLREAISTAAGEHDHTLFSPAGNVTLAIGQMAVFGSITWR